MTCILGFTGEAGSGKDTICDILVEYYGYTKYSFAQNLKELCIAVFSMKPHEVFNRDQKDRPLSSSIFLRDYHVNDLVHWIQRKNGIAVEGPQREKMMALVEKHIVFNTPREVLQYVGTDMMRNCISPMIHIDILGKQIEQEKPDYACITDARFTNERMFVVGHAPKPQFRNNRVQYARCTYVHNPDQTIAVGFSNHQSENDFGLPCDYNYVFVNDKKLGMDVCRKQTLQMITFLNLEETTPPLAKAL